MLPTWWFWPWYLAWLLPFAALRAGRERPRSHCLFVLRALFYAIYYWRDVLLNGPNWYANQFVIVGAVFGPVALYLLGASGRRLLTFEHRRERPPRGAVLPPASSSGGAGGPATVAIRHGHRVRVAAEGWMPARVLARAAGDDHQSGRPPFP